MNGEAFEHLSRTVGAIAVGRQARRALQSESNGRLDETPIVRGDERIDSDAWPQPDGAMIKIAGHTHVATLADREAVFDRSAESLHCESNMSMARSHRSPVAPGGDAWTLNISID